MYSVETLKMVTDTQFEAMGLAIGETALLRAAIFQRDKDQQDNGSMQGMDYKKIMIIQLPLFIMTSQLVYDWGQNHLKP